MKQSLKIIEPEWLKHAKNYYPDLDPSSVELIGPRDAFFAGAAVTYSNLAATIELPEREAKMVSYHIGQEIIEELEKRAAIFENRN